MSQRGVRPGLRAVRELGKTDNGTVVWSIFGGRVADTNNDTEDPKFTGAGGTDGGSADDDADDDATDDDDDSSTGDDKDDKDDDKEDRTDWYSPEEYGRLRTRMRNSDRNNEKLRLENQRLKANAAKTDDKTTDDKTDDTSTKDTGPSQRERQLSLENAFYRANAVDWIAPEDVLKLVDLTDVDVDDDGTVDTKALARALRDLAKRKPHLVKKPQRGTDDTDDDQGPSPKLNGKRKGTSPAPQRKELEKRFPALRNFGGHSG